MRLSLLFGMLIISVAAHSYDGDPVLGQQKIPSCPFCHGTNGRAENPRYPNLSGQSQSYLLSAMKAYQNGLRSGPMAKMMQTQLQRLNDKDLHDIAAFYASQGE